MDLCARHDLIIRLGSNQRFLEKADKPIDLLLSDPPWGAGTQNMKTPYVYQDNPENRDAVILPLAAYAGRCAKTALIACDDRWQPYWTIALRDQLFNTSLIICESELGNPGKRNFGKKHYYWVHAWRGEAPTYFDYDALPVVDRRDKIGEGRAKKACSVIRTTMSNTDPERVSGFVAQKPIWLMEAFIRTLCPWRGVVVDPYVGTGSVAIASFLTGRNFFGFEENPNTYRLAEDRLNDYRHNREKLLRIEGSP